MSGSELLPSSAFFASRNGVCVYVTLERVSVRVCFESSEADGYVEGDREPSPQLEERAIALAKAAFLAHRELLRPLFDVVASASPGADEAGDAPR